MRLPASVFEMDQAAASNLRWDVGILVAVLVPLDGLHLTSQFASVWWAAYLAAFAVPILGIASGSGISIRDVRARHACVITTAQRSITAAVIVTVFNYTQPLANVSVTIINAIGIVILLILGIEWGRAQVRKSPAASTSLAASARAPTGRSQ